MNVPFSGAARFLIVMTFCAVATLLAIGGCDRDGAVSPTAESAVGAPAFAIAGQEREIPLASNPQIASMLSRARVIKPSQYELVVEDSDPANGVFVYRRVDPEARHLKPGAILLGQSVGTPREVTRVTRQDDKIRVQTIPANWDLVSNVGALGFDVPLRAGAGEKDGVTWGPWRLTDANPVSGLQTSSGSVIDPSDFDPADILFNGFSICGGGDASEFCLDFDVTIVDGHFNLDGGTHFSIDAGDCYDPTSIICDFNPIENISAWAWEKMDAALTVNVKGGGHIGLEKCFYGYCVPNLTAVRDFEVAGMPGALKLGLVVGIQVGVTDMEFETGFALEESLAVGARWSSAHGFAPVWGASGSFDTSFDMISYGSGFAKIYVGPKLEVTFDALGEDDVFSVEIGAFPYARGSIDINDLVATCPNYSTTVDVGVDAIVEANVDFLILGAEVDLVFGLEPDTLAQFWGTGDLDVHTSVTGVDIDPEYRVSAWRTDPTDAPEWDTSLSSRIGANETVSWGGTRCRVFSPPFIDPIWSDCRLVATDHMVAIDEVMWNCALAAESPAAICIDPTEKTEYTFEISCISVFKALCLYIDECSAADMIRAPGIANSLCSKMQAAEAARDRGAINAASNILYAALNEIAAQDGKGMAPEVANELRLRIRQVSTQYLAATRFARQ